jgi:hypothetical protein
MMNMDTDKHLVGHWPLDGDDRNCSACDLSSEAQDVVFDNCDGKPAAMFNGTNSRITVDDHPAMRLGKDNFTITLWLHTKSGVDGGDIVGDLLSKFDADTRRGMNLVVSTHTGVTHTTQPNYRHIQFGIDNAQVDPQWTDCGRPGNAVKVAALATVEGSLYAGTFVNRSDHNGHLWRYEADDKWIDLGAAPPKCNCVGSIAFFDSALHCSTGRYNPKGSALGDPQNPRPGGNVYRVEDDGKWIDLGHPGAEGAKADDVSCSYAASDQADETVCLTAYRGQLFAISHHCRGVYKYEGGKHWQLIGPDHRIMSMTIHQGSLYALVNGSGVYRYEGGNDWTYCGDPPRSIQTFCAVTYQGTLHVGTWPECEIIKYNGGESWTVVGRIGYEREVMGAALYNGKCYFGTLPMANVFRMDGNRFTYFGNLDNDTSTHLRRVWSMSTYRGQLFAGTLPQGKVMRKQMGRVVTYDNALPSGWRHITAVREGTELKLYLDGKQVAQSISMNPNDFDLDNYQPLLIGGGIGHALNGSLRDVRLYNRAIDAQQVCELADPNVNL